MKKLFLLICIFAYFIPIFGQNDADTLSVDGFFLKYNSPLYSIRYNSPPPPNTTFITMEMIKNNDFHIDSPHDWVMLRGKLDRTTKTIGLTYKVIPQYIISETFILKAPPTNPEELIRTAGNGILSQWIHKDGECILIIKCPMVNGSIDRSIDKLPNKSFYWIKRILDIEPASIKLTEENIEEIKKKTTVWSPEKSKEAFNAQYVITCPVEDEKAVYMGKYSHKLELIMIKWGQDFSVSFLVTKKGNENIKKYIKEVESAFRFID